MALTGNSIEEKIYNFLYGRIKNAFGVSGLMGNLYAESGLVPTNLQNSFEKKLGYTDDTYTTSVDNGTVDLLEQERKPAPFCTLQKSVYRRFGITA